MRGQSAQAGADSAEPGTGKASMDQEGEVAYI